MLSIEELLTENEGKDVVDPASDTSDRQLSERPRGVVHTGCSGTQAPLHFVVAMVAVVVVMEETTVKASATLRGDRLMACA